MSIARGNCIFPCTPCWHRCFVHYAAAMCLLRKESKTVCAVVRGSGLAESLFEDPGLDQIAEARWWLEMQRLHIGLLQCS